MGSPMFSCPGDFHFGIEPLDGVYLIAGRYTPKSLPWKAITFKCESAGDILTIKEEPLFKFFCFLVCSHLQQTFPVGKQLFENCPKQKNILGTKVQISSVLFGALEFRSCVLYRCQSKNKWSNTYGCQEAANNDKGWNIQKYHVLQNLCSCSILFNWESLFNTEPIIPQWLSFLSCYFFIKI